MSNDFESVKIFISDAISPMKMPKSEAVDFLEELRDEYIQPLIDAIRDEIELENGK